MNSYSKRDVLKLLAAGTIVALTAPRTLFGNDEDAKKKRHYITLSFDDGFKKSSIQTAEIYEKYNLSACINVIATAHLPGFELPNEYHNWPVGDFGLWNELKQRGHEIMMHGYQHKSKKTMSFEEGKAQILRCIDYFDKNLKGFDPKESVFNFPFNQSTAELEEWLPTQIKAFRTGGPAINQVPHKGQSFLTCTTYGPGNCEKHLDVEIDTLLQQPSGWLIYNTHGLDNEGWGPISADYLDRLLARLSKIESVKLIPAGQALPAY